ncbi:MAG: hypothetical protein QOE70_3250 [Chthoniobacter sp.]|jgi:hypothetical protein|nr:hypothetical protein [Chthoniobacter sp.]
MKAGELLALSLWMALAMANSHAQDASKPPARSERLYASFGGLDEVVNPDTGRIELVCLVSLGRAPLGNMLLRRGDKVAGFLIGEMKNREPVRSARDGIVPGTLPTLELTHVASGRTAILEEGRAVDFGPWPVPTIPAGYDKAAAEKRSHFAEMLATFVGTEEVVNPETRQKETVVHLRFDDLLIPEQPMVLHRGDEVAGYRIGEVKSAAPKKDPAGRVVSAAGETLEIIGSEKFVLEKQKPQIVYR